MNTIWIILFGAQSAQNANTENLTPMEALIAFIIVAAVVALPVAYLIVRGFIEDVKAGYYRRSAR